MAGAFCMERGVFVYPVSEAFLRAVQENTRRYYWTGKITTKGGAVYPFGYGEKVKAYLRRGARPLQGQVWNWNSFLLFERRPYGGQYEALQQR